MMRQILDKDIHNELITAFLLGWRLKPETITEFRGALSACDSYITSTKIENSIELGYPFDGKAKNPYIFPLAANILKNSELNLVVVGDEKLPSKNGTTMKEICTNIALESNIHYFDRADFFNELHQLTDLRKLLGLRTGLNTIEKLPKVANSEYAITGVFHKPYVKKYIDIFAQRYKRFALIQGNEGTPELFSKGNLWITENGNVEEFAINPEKYGVNYKKALESITMPDSLEQLNEPSDELLKIAKLNAAILLFVAQRAKSIDEAYERLN